MAEPTAGDRKRALAIVAKRYPVVTETNGEAHAWWEDIAQALADERARNVASLRGRAQMRSLTDREAAEELRRAADALEADDE